MAEEIAAKTKQNGKVMIAIDGSDCSSYTLKWALDNLVDKLKSGVIIFTAFSADYSGVFSGSYGSSIHVGKLLSSTYAALDLVTSLQDNQKSFTFSLLAKAKEICAKYGIDAETVSLTGNPKEAICDAVQKFHCQLLVMGSRSRGAIKRTFLGSVSDYCVHQAKCPVLVVKQPV